MDAFSFAGSCKFERNLECASTPSHFLSYNLILSGVNQAILH